MSDEHTPLTEAELADLERLDRDGTQGEWDLLPAVQTPGMDRDYGIVAPGCANVIGEFYEHFVRRGERHPELAKANAELATKSRNALPRLLREVRRLRQAQQEGEEREGLIEEWRAAYRDCDAVLDSEEPGWAERMTAAHLRYDVAIEALLAALEGKEGRHE